MTETQSPELTAAQIRTLQNLLTAGFQFTTIERITRHLAVEKSGFIALLDPAGGKLQLFGQVGYRLGAGIGMLIEQRGTPVFMWKKEAVSATPELLAAYARVKDELAEILREQSTVRG
jgi:hypothetical protein